MRRDKVRRTYLPRIIGDKVMMPADLKRLHKSMLDVEHIGIISDEMREVVQSEWPEVAHTAVCSISPSLARNELRGFLHDQCKLVFDGSSSITNTPVAGKKNVALLLDCDKHVLGIDNLQAKRQ